MVHSATTRAALSALLLSAALATGCEERPTAIASEVASSEAAKPGVGVLAPHDEELASPCELVSEPGEPARFKATRLNGSKRYVVLGGTLAEIASALGHEAELVGTDTSSTYPDTVQALPKVGYYRKVSPEGVLSLTPTHVIATAEAGPAEALTQFEGAGVTVERVESEQEGALGAYARVRRVGELLGEAQCAEQLVAAMQQDLEQVEARRAELKETPIKVLFIYARGANMLMVAGQETAAEEMLTLAGFENAVQGVEGFKPLSPEVVVKAQPDVILIPEQGAESLGGHQGVLALPGLAMTEAAQHGRLVTSDDLALIGFGPRFPRALKQLQRDVERSAAAAANEEPAAP